MVQRFALDVTARARAARELVCTEKAHPRADGQGLGCARIRAVFAVRL